MTTENGTACGRQFGYARVSTKTQHEDRQVISLLGEGVQEKHLYVDKLSGKDFNRPMYRQLLAKLQPGDVLIVSSIDRLGRNYDEVVEQWRQLTKERKIHIVVLDMPLLDTRNRDAKLMDTFVADIVLQILSYVAQNERETMQQRQREGIEAARLKGVRFGRPPKKKPRQYAKVYAAWKSGDMTLRAAAAKLGISEKTFRRWEEKA